MELTPILILTTGFVLGLGHSLDPDHVVAVSALLCNNTSLRRSIVSATAWGAGHSITLFLVGLIVLALRVSIPQSIIAVFEFAAGVLLVILGFLVVKPIVSTRIQGQKDNAQNQTNKHLHSDEGDSTRLTHLHQSAITGGLQGLGGSAALMLVTLTTVSSVELGLVFILLFGVGMIIGMMGVACLVSSVLTYTASRLKSVHDSIKAITGIASIVFGIFIIVQIL